MKKTVLILMTLSLLAFMGCQATPDDAGELNQTSVTENSSDLDAKWGAGVHYSDTYTWAKSCGFIEANAVALATGDLTTDTSTATAGRLTDTSTWPYNHDEYHFNMNSSSPSDIESDNDTRIIKYKEYYAKSVSAYNAASQKYRAEIARINKKYSSWYQYPLKKAAQAAAYATRGTERASAFNDLGTALHAYQDIFAHGNVQNMTQHDSFRDPADSSIKVIDNPNYDINFFTKVVTKVAGGYQYATRWNKTKAKSIEIITNFKRDVSYDPND